MIMLLSIWCITDQRNSLIKSTISYPSTLLVAPRGPSDREQTRLLRAPRIGVGMLLEQLFGPQVLQLHVVDASSTTSSELDIALPQLKQV
jgi:hypothetical protein